MLSSRTARRETTTLLRLRSNLITLKSHSLFSNGVVSLTGRKSTNEPGKNARMPLTITVKPPLTRPFTMPLMMRASFIASSRSSHAARRFAFSRDNFVEP